VPANVVQRDAGHERFIAIVKGDAAIEHLSDQRDHIVHLERDALVRMAHAAPGTVRHLAILKVVPRPRKQVVVAGMVVMEVADDDVGDLFGIDVDRSQSFGNRFDDGATALGRHRMVEAGVHDKGAV
jgi:hypothetical protein